MLDCGLFHICDADERARFVASVASVTEAGRALYVLCFSDDGPDTGPHPVRQDELRAAFSAGTGWHVVAVEPERVRTRFHGDAGAPAWLATIKRIHWPGQRYMSIDPRLCYSPMPTGFPSMIWSRYSDRP